MLDMKETVNFTGVPVTIFNKEYIMPALSPFAYAKCKAGEKLSAIQKELISVQSEASKMAAELEKEVPDISKVDHGKLAFSDESYVSMIELVTLALKRNYPEITEDEVGNGIADGMTLMGLANHLVSQDEKLKAEMAKHIKNVLK